MKEKFSIRSEGGRLVNFSVYDDSSLGIEITEHGLDLSIEFLDAVISNPDAAKLRDVLIKQIPVRSLQEKYNLIDAIRKMGVQI